MIEKSDLTNIEILIEIWENSVKATHDFLTEEDFQFIKSVLPQYFAGVILYEHKDKDEKINGFIGIHNENIEMLFINNSSRGKGIGKKLVQFAIKSLHCTKVDVNEQNTQALKFYQNMGFKIVGRDPFDGLGKPYPILHMHL